MENATPGTMTVAIMEEQEIFQNAYKEIFPPAGNHQISFIRTDINRQVLVRRLQEIKPDILLFGIKRVQSSSAESLCESRDGLINMGLVISAFSLTQ